MDTKVGLLYVENDNSSSIFLSHFTPAPCFHHTTHRNKVNKHATQKNKGGKTNILRGESPFFDPPTCSHKPIIFSDEIHLFNNRMKQRFTGHHIQGAFPLVNVQAPKKTFFSHSKFFINTRWIFLCSRLKDTVSCPSPFSFV